MAEHKPKKFRLSFVNAAEDVPRLVRAYGRACFGEFALVMRPAERRGVLVLVTKEGARMWKSSTDADAPHLPDVAITPADAVMLIRTEQKAVPKPGPITLRGQWSGLLHCDGGKPRVEVWRKLAAYGVLRIVSGDDGWAWTVERVEKWFTKPGSDSGTASTLLAAIEAGLGRAMGLLGEACSVRDSRRRAALDSTFAVDHPIKPAKEGRDPTERLKEPRRGKAPPPAEIEAPIDLPDAPETPDALKRMADEVTAEADALAALRGVPWVWSEGSARDAAATWFAEHGLEDLAAVIRDYEGGPDHPLPRFVADLKKRVKRAELDEPTRKDAVARIDALRAGLTEAPQLVERARRLIRYAARMAESKLCRGKEQREAVEAVQRAVAAYEEARKAIADGAPVDGVRTLRRIGERVALAAAKAARSCASGSGSSPKEPRATKKPRAPRKARADRDLHPPGEADTTKDKALLDAFSSAIAAAMQDSA